MLALPSTRCGCSTKNGRVTGVATDHGTVNTDYVVNAGGMWARSLGKKSGVNVPLHACEHYYAVTEKLEAVHRDLPVLRDHDKCVYIKEDAGFLLISALTSCRGTWTSS